MIEQNKKNTKSSKFMSNERKNLTPVIRNQQIFTLQETQKISNAIVMQINMLAGQLFELLNNLGSNLLYRSFSDLLQ